MASAPGRLSRRPWYSSMLELSRYTLFTSCASGPITSGLYKTPKQTLRAWEPENPTLRGSNVPEGAFVADCGLMQTEVCIFLACEYTTLQDSSSQARKTQTTVCIDPQTATNVPQSALPNNFLEGQKATVYVRANARLGEIHDGDSRRHNFRIRGTR